VLERRGDADWTMVEPTKGSARAPRVEDLLYTVRALRWKEVVAPGGEDAAKYGLDAPTMEIVLLEENGGELAHLTVGKRDGERVYVRSGASQTIYAVDASALGPEPKIPDDFKA